jgi:hypothetical protein
VVNSAVCVQEQKHYKWSQSKNLLSTFILPTFQEKSCIKEPILVGYNMMKKIVHSVHINFFASISGNPLWKRDFGNVNIMYLHISIL